MNKTVTHRKQTSPSNQNPLLIEVGVEEIPSNVLAASLEQLSEKTQANLSEVRIPFSPPQPYGTPRRLVLFIPHLAPKQETLSDFVIGPPKKAAFDKSGDPTAAATGFAKSQGVALSDIKIQNTETLGKAAGGKKGEYLVYKKKSEGKETKVLLRTIIPEILSSLSFPRSMKWNQTGVSFVRPIRSIVALYDGKVIPFSFAGIVSGDRSFGHHLMAPEPFQVSDFEDYQEALRDRFVFIDPKERVRIIESEMQSLAKEKEGILDLSNRDLLWDAAYTVEYPKAICGAFDSSFLAIPKEIIITAMAEHQGYFALYDQEQNLLPHFITISNIKTEDMSIIQKGNERVLRARLVDAQFYFDQDRKQKLADFVTALQRVTFQEKLGTVYEKTERITALSVFIAKEVRCSDTEIKAVERTAFLSKGDLTTGVVREFTSLQGTMGSIYAALDGEETGVADAIEEHWLPKYSGASLPKTLYGQILAIADKLDTICGCFGVGLIPSGSEDPYALRRQGLGLIQILITAPIFKTLSLEAAIREALCQYENQNKFSGESQLSTVSNFLKQRLDTHLQSEDVRYDLRDAILNGEIDKPCEIVARANALVRFSQAPQFGPLMTAFKRAIRILPDRFNGMVNPDLLNEPAEKELYTALTAVDESMNGLSAEQRYVEVLESLATLYEPLNRFFDDVLVMDKNEALRQNRLSLLHKVQQQFEPFGNFSKIVEGELGSTT